MAEKNVSTALSQEREVGMKWNVSADAKPTRRSPWDACGLHSYGVDDPADGHLPFDGVEEADELLVPMVLQPTREGTA